MICSRVSRYDMIPAMYFAVSLALLLSLEAVFSLYMGSAARIKGDSRFIFVFQAVSFIVVYMMGYISGVITARTSVEEYEASIIKRYLEGSGSSHAANNHSVYGTFPVAISSFREPVAC